jgi:ATP phosphoribosyltransferase
MIYTMHPDRIRLALPDADSLDAICGQLRACGFKLPDLSLPGLHLVRDPLGCRVDFEVFKLAAPDVGTYVEHGISHLGVMSTELIREAHVRVWHPYTFTFGQRPLVLVAPLGMTMENLTGRPLVRLATSLPNLTRDIFAARGLAIEVVHVSDCMSACLLGLADGYVDRLYDPQTLIRDGFRVLEVLGTARLKLVLNPACYATRKPTLRALIKALNVHQPPAPPPIEIPFDDEF